jgi:hypothetical protein
MIVRVRVNRTVASGEVSWRVQSASGYSYYTAKENAKLAAKYADSKAIVQKVNMPAYRWVKVV